MLTAGTDVATANVFEAGLVFTPGGNDRINALQDEDRLTGAGTNATLNATLGNANDNGGTTVTPTLNNIQTINAAFTGAANGPQGQPVRILDLQDATGLTTINTTRLSSGLGADGATYANLESAATNNFGISGVAVKTTLNFDYQEGVLAAPGQSATFRVNSVQLNQLNAHNNAGGAAGATTSEGFENVTINSAGGNQIDRLTVAQMRNLTLEGAGSLGINNFAANAIAGAVTTLGTTTQIGASEAQVFTPNAIVNVNAPLERITGTTATGALSIDISGFEGIQTDPANSGRTVFLNAQGGTAADKIIHGNAIADVGLVINGGAGRDTLASYASILDTNPANANNPDISNIESLEVRAQVNRTINIDLSEIGGLESTLLRNEASVVNAAALAANVAAATAALAAAVAGGNAAAIQAAQNNLAAAQQAQNAASDVVFGLLEVTQAQANDISINHGTTRGNGINVNGAANDGTTVRVNLNDASGTNDTVTIRTVTDQNNNVRFNFALDADGNQFAEQFAAVGGAAAFGNNNNRAGNPALDANNQPINARVENITINDTDNESNAIELTRAQSQAANAGANNFRENADNHRGTVSITGGVAGQFLNLDATANAYRWDQSGAALDGGTGSAAITAINGRATNGSRSDIGTATAERLVAARIDSSTYAGDVVVRVSDNLAAGSLGGQNITFGAGNDTVIFDQVNQTALNRNTAGLTISDTVSGGAGNDILGLDGEGFAVTITASEWTNVSGFEIIRTIGNGGTDPAANTVANTSNARGATNNYNLTLTNDLLANNGTADAGVKRIIIVNDNDATNDRADTANDQGNLGQGANGNIAGATGVERGITIDARTLNANNSFEYRGEERGDNVNQVAPEALNQFVVRTADRFIMADANINGAAIIDGGGASNATTVTNVNRDVDSVRNADVLEVRNSATVSAGDLANITNVGTLEFTNDTAAVQNSILVLDDTIVDRMVDAYQASRVDNLGLTTPILQNQERLVVKAIDNLLVNGANTGLTLQADSLTGRSAVDLLLGRGNHNVVTGGGNDAVTLLGNYATGTLNTNFLNGLTGQEALGGLANNGTGVSVFTGVINLGGQTGQAGTNLPTNDTLTTFGSISLAGATLTGVESVTMNGTTGNDTIIGSAQADTITGGAGADQLTGGLGGDVFVQGLTDSVAGLVANLNVNAVQLNTTITFGSGVDVIRDFVGGAAIAGANAGDRLDVVVNQAFTTLIGADATNLANNTLYVQRGNFNETTRVFTVDNAGTSTLVVQNETAVTANDVLGTNTTAVVLLGVTNLSQADVF